MFCRVKTRPGDGYGDMDVDERREQLEVKVQRSQRSGISSGDVTTKVFFSDVTWSSQGQVKLMTNIQV